jgi:transmembrane sensor
MDLQRKIEYLQALRASEWFEVLKEPRSEDRVAFTEWCKQSPLHTAEFLEIAWTDQVFDQLDPNREIDVESLLKQINPNVTSWQTQERPAEAPVKPPHRIWKWAWAAALVSCGFGLGLSIRSDVDAHELTTKVGELRTVRLDDESTITINTDSEIHVRYERKRRDIELRRGEAVFKVAHDAERPFRVHTRTGVVQAIGTQFNVYERPDGTDVVVLEGRVKLTPHAAGGSVAIPNELATGQEARIALDGSIHRAEHADIARVLAWNKRRLKFDSVPLEEMVREFNRYHSDVRVRLDGVLPGSHHYTAVLDADDPTALTRFLSLAPDLTVQRVGNEVVIRPRPVDRTLQ